MITILAFMETFRAHRAHKLLNLLMVSKWLKQARHYFQGVIFISQSISRLFHELIKVERI